LQYYLREYLEGQVVTSADVAELSHLQDEHMHGTHFNDGLWRIVRHHGGRLPVRICAAPEGSVIPVGNVLMTVETTDPLCPWLDLETLLMKVWYPTTVATRSWHLKQAMVQAVKDTGGDPALADYMLHDFGYRGASSEETALLGGAARTC
jgi:nicotinamide phosphoribosyltransferase